MHRLDVQKLADDATLNSFHYTVIAWVTVILALDGLQPDVGHEVLWVVRDCLSEEILLARPLLSSTQGDLTALLKEVKELLKELVVPVNRKRVRCS